MQVSAGSVDPHSEHARLVPFLGSAVSLFEPTSLPTWPAYTRAVVEALVAAGGHELRADLLGAACHWSNCQRTLETVTRRLGSAYLEVIRGVLARPPNSVHEFIADRICAGQYPAVVSTNFDRAVEDALRARRVPVCEVCGQDRGSDAAALDALSSAPSASGVRVVVVVGPRAFDAIERVPNLVGREGWCVLFKVHGDAGYPGTCVDTELQRAQGLPASVRTTLSILLRRFPMLFMGWGGGDLDHNQDYLRLESEADKARLYWLLRDGAEEPPVLPKLRAVFAAKGGSLQVVRGALVGTVANQDSFQASAAAWARDCVGAVWSRLAVQDLERVFAVGRDGSGESKNKVSSGSNNSNTADRSKRKSGAAVAAAESEPGALASAASNWAARAAAERAAMAVVAPQPARSSLLARACGALLPRGAGAGAGAGASQRQFSARSASLTVANLDALELLGLGQLERAWARAREAIVLARKLLDGDLCFVDAWVPFAVGALVHACAGAGAQARLLLSDAVIVAHQSGNTRAGELLGGELITGALGCNEEEQHEAEASGSVSASDEVPREQEPLKVFALSLDNVARAPSGGFPEDLMMRAELVHAVLVSDRVLVPQQALLVSRVLVTEVLFDKHGEPHTALLERIQPLMQASRRGDRAPLLSQRKEFEANPRFLNEAIPMSFFEKMQRFYNEHAGAPQPEFFDLARIATCYQQRSLAVASDPRAIEKAFPGQDCGQAEAAGVLPLVADFIRAVTHQGTPPAPTSASATSASATPAPSTALTRSDMYRLGNLFPQHPTSGEELWDSLDAAARQLLGDKEAFLARRSTALSRPWHTAEMLKLLADAAYVTNLPVAGKLSLVLTDASPESRETRMLNIARVALASEGLSVPETVLDKMRVDALLLARLSMPQVTELRGSAQGRRFRSAARDFRDDASAANGALLDAVAADFARLLSSKLVHPRDRALPARLAVRAAAGRAGLDAAVRELRARALGDITAAMSRPPRPLYDVPTIAFPGLLVLPASRAA
jgi:hypothetical protein